MTAKDLIKELKQNADSKKQNEVLKFFHGNDGKTKALGVKFGDVFKLAKKYSKLTLKEINILLDSEYYEVRMSAVSIMDFQAKDKKTSQERKKELFDLYIKRHDRLNNWDFVDRGAISIIGEYLLDKPKNILFQLAKSKNIWKRRTAIVSTYAFIRKKELDYTFSIAEVLVYDKHELINKAVGSWIREAGKKDEKRLKLFLEKHASQMPKITLSYAIEKFDKESKEYFRGLAKNKTSTL